jgi:hypothetical protein
MLFFIAAEENYLLTDKASERKYKFNFRDSLKQVRTRKSGKLLEKMLFYVTQNVPVDVGLLKNVAKANGGDVCFVSCWCSLPNRDCSGDNESMLGSYPQCEARPVLDLLPSGCESVETNR